MDYPFFVATGAGGEICAWLAWRPVATDEFEVLVLETRAQFQRRGLARGLLRILKEHVVGVLFLEVRPSNEAALQLYQSEGFRVEGRRPDYYHQPPEDAVVMKFHPC